MNKSEYRTYLQSEHFRFLRAMLIVRESGFCQRCQNRPNDFKHLHVHHLTYDRIGEEDPEDIELLCSRCHYDEHHMTAQEYWDKRAAELVREHRQTGRGIAPLDLYRPLED